MAEALQTTSFGPERRGHAGCREEILGSTATRGEGELCTRRHVARRAGARLRREMRALRNQE
jgi:hypothetical protein